MSGLDFLALVLQSSNSFDMKAFFQVLFSLLLSAHKGDIHLMALGSWCPTGVFGRSREKCFLFFFLLKSSNCFPIKTHVFGMSFIICTLCLKRWGFEFAPARGSPSSVTDLVMTSQDYIEVEHVGTWLLSSSLAKIQQFWAECIFFIFPSVYFFLVTMSIFKNCIWGPWVSRGSLV